MYIVGTVLWISGGTTTAILDRPKSPTQFGGDPYAQYQAPLGHSQFGGLPLPPGATLVDNQYRPYWLMLLLFLPPPEDV
jgi:hypothetical protein